MRQGLLRGWTEFKLSVRSPQDQGYYLFTALAVLFYLILRRNTEVEGTDLLLPSVALASILGALVGFGVVIGPAYTLAMEREDGRLMSNGAQGWAILVLFVSLGMLAMMPLGC